MTSLLEWMKFAALAWLAGLLVVLLAEWRPLRRRFPDWLRNLSRLVVLAGAVGALVLAFLIGAEITIDLLEARAQAETGPTLDLSFESADSFGSGSRSDG